MMFRTFVSLVLVGTIGIALQAALTPANALLVPEKAQNALVIVDRVSLTSAARGPVG